MWTRHGYLKSNGRPIANADLWREIAYWMVQCSNVVVLHVRADDTQVEGNDDTHRRRLRALVH